VHDDAHGRPPEADPPVGRLTELAGTAADDLGEMAGHVVDPRADWRWTAGDTGRVAIAGATLLIGGIAASRGVPAWEGSVFLKVNGMPDELYPVLWPVMQLGNVWVGTAAAAGAALLIRRPRAAIVLLATPVTAWMLAKGVKAVVDRGRPDAVGLVVHQRGTAETGLGFISGHATVAFALAGALAAHLRRPWRDLLLGLAGAVGISRIYVGVHLPLDVVGGAACGLLIGEAARAAELSAQRRTARRTARSG
jgi:membrane-associated phospholipid phosphatase